MPPKPRHRPAFAPPKPPAPGVLLALTALLAWTAAAPAPAQEARRLQLQPPPAYVTTAAWLPHGNLMILDPVKNQLSEIWVENGEVRPLEQLEEVPSGLRPLEPKGYLLSWEHPERFTELSMTLEPKGTWECEGCSLSTWIPVFKDRIVAVGEVQMKAEESGGAEGADEAAEDDRRGWRTGIFWAGPSGVELALPLPERALPMYLLGMPYLAVADHRAFAVVVDRDGGQGRPYYQVIEVPRHGEEPRVVTRLPEIPPQLDFGGVAEVADDYDTLSRHRMPTGLLGWEGNLYLLRREPSFGHSVWRLEPDSGAVFFIDRIETDSPFLTVIPGPQSWAFFEKGPMLGFGQQSHRFLRLLPSYHFQG